MKPKSLLLRETRESGPVEDFLKCPAGSAVKVTIAQERDSYASMLKKTSKIVETLTIT